MDSKYRTFKLEKLDPISPTFCAAKWLTSDIYLHTGKTSSCEKPVPGVIDLAQVSNNTLAIHNTNEKIQQRMLMLKGQQPDKCKNCWDIENATPDVASQRVWLSHSLKDTDFTTLDLSEYVIPQVITLMFDNYCNFVCTYCDPTQSSSWATDLKVNGPYRQIKNDPRNTYIRLGTKDRLGEADQEFLYQQTSKMISDNIGKIRKLRFLGGEPTINVKFWRFFEELRQVDTAHIEVEIVTNLSHIDRVLKLLKEKNRFKQLRLLVSIDGTGSKAEFVRQGLNWNLFEKNVQDILNHTDVFVGFMGTINVLALDGLIELLDWIKKLGKQSQISYRSYVVHHPEFQKIDILPQHLRNSYRYAIMNWIKENPNQSAETLESLMAIAVTLEHSPECSPGLVDDFRYFVKEFAIRHKLDIGTTFSTTLSNFINQQEI